MQIGPNTSILPGQQNIHFLDLSLKHAYHPGRNLQYSAPIRIGYCMDRSYGADGVTQFDQTVHSEL